MVAQGGGPRASRKIRNLGVQKDSLQIHAVDVRS
jgi:hypothetical protein